MGLVIAFWILAVIAVAAALNVVLIRNTFRAAFSLILCFLAIAGLFVTLSADFLAAVQILVYVGAIAVLIILAIMMTRDVQHGSPSNKLRIPAFITAVVFLGVVTFSVLTTKWPVSSAAAEFPTTASLAERIFGQGGYVLAMEIAPLLLLAAILGAIVLVREN
ncbi:NADH-quinone oxidoreductase subunit J [Chloroflexota bacterium]